MSCSIVGVEYRGESSMAASSLIFHVLAGPVQGVLDGSNEPVPLLGSGTISSRQLANALAGIAATERTR